MKTLRPVLIALVALAMLAAPGCRTGGLGNLSKPPSLLPPGSNETAAELLVEHNRNAGRVQSLKARPEIKIDDRRRFFGASGKLAIERPKNFKLELSVAMANAADIGSNDEEFWFWISHSDEKAIYYCDYDENGHSPLAGSLQPEWITETLGMKLFSEDEIAEMKVRTGIEPGTLILSHSEKTAQGETIIKEMVISEATHRIREHKVFAADHKTLLAHATIPEYLDVPVPASTDDSEPSGQKVFLPKVLKLEWIQEKLSLQILLSQVEINPKFTETSRAAMFVEPTIRGFNRVNLATRAGVPQTKLPPTRIRETMPAPAPRVKLSEPTPLGSEGAGAGRTRRGPLAIVADLPPARPVEIEAVVGPTIPKVSEPRPGSLDTRPGWRNTVER